MGAQFSRVRPSENRFRERLRTTTARENAKNRFLRPLLTHFFSPGPVFDRFWGSGRVPKISQNRYFENDGGPRSATFRRSCSKCLLKPLRAQTITENHRKVIENYPKIDRRLTAPSALVCLQNAGVLCQKSNINSEEKRWQAIRRASHLRGRRSRASVLNSPYPNGVLAWF